MSSAATVQGSHQQHTYTQSIHGRDPYYNTNTPNKSNTTSSGSRRASKRPSGNGSTPASPHRAQAQNSPVSNSLKINTPRTQQFAPSTQSSVPLSATATSNQPSPNGIPFAPPPRTSSQLHSSQTVTASAPDAQLPIRSIDEPLSPYQSRQVSNLENTFNNQMQYGKESTTTQTRKPAQNSPKDARRQDANAEGRSKRSPGHSRSATALGSAPHGTNLGHEGSKVINRVVIADPQEDVAREKARQAEANPVPVGAGHVIPATGVLNGEATNSGSDEAGRTRRDEGTFGSRKKELMFGDYVLGQTLGEGEFGKVRMGWKKEGGVQVAVKLIRRESLGSNPSRLPKIHREIAILRKLQHPNIVRLHEMVETERHIGIILEYASGGELFDYILRHRFLKDNAARRLFAQLVSGVGYLHKKGIVHRDLKLENLLLDRNRNIIITDFGFANTFDPDDELSDEIEYNLANKEFVERANLSIQDKEGHRRGDLMQTSCGSPCYAAPELVVSDSLYTGRKVDVWSCGVILYAMLAGYLPFDDDPANPEGDNINLLYKYIVSTPLTFPEWVSPGSKDLLKRILVPDPRKRADLFEVARHSWLSEYAHVVGFITSSTTSPSDIANITVPSDDPFEVPHLARSASVREPTRPQGVAAIGGLTPKQGGLDQSENLEKKASQRDAKRRTVQVEYVAPQSQTTRGEASPVTSPVATAAPIPMSKTRARKETQGPVEMDVEKPHKVSAYQKTAQQEPVPLRTRPVEDPYQRAIVDSNAYANPPVNITSARPSTGNSLGPRLPSRGNSYSQPVGPTVAATTASGRFSQPVRNMKYNISGPTLQLDSLAGDPLSTKPLPQRPGSAHLDASAPAQTGQRRGHKRSSTLGNVGEKLFGRRGSVFGGKAAQEHHQSKQKAYPPVSMQNGVVVGTDGSRRSSESRRTSFGFSRKLIDAPAADRRSHRFSGIFPSWTSRASSISKDGSFSRPPTQPIYPEKVEPGPTQATGTNGSRARGQPRPCMAFGRGDSSHSLSTTSSTVPVLQDSGVERQRDGRSVGSHTPMRQTASQPASYPAEYYGTTATATYDPINAAVQHQHSGRPSMNRAPSSYIAQALASSSQTQQQQQQQQQSAFDTYETNSRGKERHSQSFSKFDRQSGLQRNRKFTDAYEAETGHGHHGGSSGAARRVMDFFRKRAKARGGEEK